MRIPALLCLLFAGSDALLMKPKHMDNHKCKVMCQRFGMKALGPEFAEIHHPTECCTKCDEVYPAEASLLQTKPEGAPQPASAEAPPKQPAAGDANQR